MLSPTETIKRDDEGNILNKSCANCPSSLGRLESVDRFGKSTGSPMCGRLGTVLGRPSFDAKEEASLQKRIASTCKSYGKPLPAQPVVFSPKVSWGAPEDTLIHGIDTDPAQVNTCTQCVFYMAPDKVVSTYGWSAGLCQRKGTLVLPHETSRVGKECDVAEFGRAALQPGLELIEFYEPGYHHVDLFKTYGAGVAEHPLQHVTEKPLTDEDIAEGIMSWRKISDPENEQRFTYLPIFDPKIYTDMEKLDIPQPGDKEHPELYLDYTGAVWKVAVCWRELREASILWGPAGVGKTELGRHMAYLMQQPFVRFGITKSSEVDDLMGKTMYDPEQGTYFQRGRIAKAYGANCSLLIDEPNTGQVDVFQALRPMMDNSRRIVLDSAAGEYVDQGKHCYVLLAANSPWDALNIGAEPIADADASRMMHIRMDLPPAELETKIIQARCQLDGFQLDKSQVTGLTTIAADIRALAAEGTIPMSWGVRHQIKVARALKWFSPLNAYRLATDDLEPSNQELVFASVRSYFGDSA